MKHYSHQKRLIVVIIGMVFITACSVQPASENATVSPTELPNDINSNPSSTTLKSSSTLALPVYQGTAIPDSDYPVITTENVGDLTLVAKYGSPHILDCQPVQNGKYSLIIGASDGYWGKDLVSGEMQKIVDALAFSEWSGNYYVNGYKNSGLSFSADGQYFLGTPDDFVFAIWNEDGEKVYEIETDRVSSDTYASLSSDGSMLALATCAKNGQENDCITEVINWKTNEVIKNIKGNSPIFSPDGKFLVINVDKKVEFFSTIDWQVSEYIWQPNTGMDIPIQFSTSGNLFAFKNKKVVEIHRSADLTLLSSIPWEDHMEGIQQILFSTDEQKVMFISNSNQQFLFNISTAELISSSEYSPSSCNWLGEGDAIQNFDFDTQWDVESEWFTKFYELFDFSRDYSIQAALHFPNDFEIRGPNDSSQFTLYRNAEYLATFTGLTNNFVPFSTNEIVVINSSSEETGQAQTQIIDLSTGEVIQKWDQVAERYFLGDEILFFSLSPFSGRRSKSEATLIGFSLAEKRTVIEKEEIADPLFVMDDQEKIGHFDDLGCLLFSRFYQDTSSEKLCFLPKQYINHNLYILDAAVSPDGKLLVIGVTNFNAYIIDLEKMSLLGVKKITDRWIEDIQFSHDGTMLMISPQNYSGHYYIWGIGE